MKIFSVGGKYRTFIILLAITFAISIVAGTLCFSALYDEPTEAYSNTETSASGYVGDLTPTTSGVDVTVLTKLMSKVGDTGYSGTKTARDINSGTTVIFKMAGYYWQAVYRNKDYLTVWMTKPYTNSTNTAGVEYASSVLRTNTINAYNTLESSYPILANIIATPSVAMPSQETQSKSCYYSTTRYATNTLAGAMSDMFWIPSTYEVGNISSTTRDETEPYGLWELTSTEMGSSSNTWLRGYREGSSSANPMVYSSGGEVYQSSYSNSCGLRPACHINLDAFYKIIFNSNGGSSCATQYAYNTYDSLPTPTKAGNTFMGWFTSSGFAGSPVTTSTTVTSNHTLYAKWVSVSFVSNGGSACDNLAGKANSTYTSITYNALPTPTKEGYLFYGWYKNSDLSGTKVTNSTTYTASHTLYAKWGVVLTLNLQGGTGITSIHTPYNEPMDTSTPPTMTGFSFAGYFTQPLGKAVQYYSSSMTSVHTCDLLNGTVLYACWQSTLNLDLQGGTGDTSVIAIYNDGMPVILKPIRSGYTFGGYFTGKNGTGVRYYTNSMSSAHLNDLPNGTTLYAYWMINTYMIYYNPNGGTVNNTEATVTFGATVTPPTPTRSGYTFFGWFIDGERYTGGIWTFTENKTATAKWGYTLTYNANGGYVLPGSVTLTDGDVITPPTPTRDGCTFAGWKIGSAVYSGGVWAYTSNQTAVAQWNCDLTAYCADDQQGYITGSADGVYAVGASVTLTATAESGYVFDCWVVNNRKVKTATYTTNISMHTTAVAHFVKTNPTANVYASNGTIASTYLNLEPESYSATLRITPETGKYVETISFDNVAYYTIDSWSSTLYANSTFAQNVRYQANEGNNDLWLTFNYYNTTKPVNVYVKLTTTKYADLSVPKNTGGALDGIAVSANFGGTVTLVGDDYESLADSDTIICSAKLAQGGYEFVGWVYADSPSNILSTEMSEKFKKSDIYGRQLMACFKPTDDNPNYNMQLDNE